MTNSQLIVWLGSKRATVLALGNASSTKAVGVYTNILVVVPPFSGINQGAIDLAMKAIARADSIRVRLAILEPDGRMTPFTSDLNEVHSEMMQAVSVHLHYQSRSKWPFYEEAAFMSLRKLAGRHVTVVLRDRGNPFHSEVKKSFGDDRTLDSLALFDASQVYRLVQPSSLALSIPMGGASAEHLDIGAENHAQYQADKVLGAGRDQDRLWAQRNPGSISNGGRDETEIDALFRDILEDAAGSYDSIVQGSAPCETGKMYPANVSATDLIYVSSDQRRFS